MTAWRLLIDGKKQGSGPFVFDVEEPGYLAGLSRGMAYALTRVNEPLTVELMEAIRKETVLDVKKVNSTDFQIEIGGSGVLFTLNLASNATEEGLAELREKIKNDPLRALETNDKGNLILTRKSADRATLYPLVKKILDEYEQSQKNERDIARLCQDLDQLHPFNDGNVRTFVIILIQKELARNQRTPVILYDPNRFDAYAISQLEKEIINGQQEYKAYLIPK